MGWTGGLAWCWLLLALFLSTHTCAIMRFLRLLATNGRVLFACAIVAHEEECRRNCERQEIAGHAHRMGDSVVLTLPTAHVSLDAFAAPDAGVDALDVGFNDGTGLLFNAEGIEGRVVGWQSSHGLRLQGRCCPARHPLRSRTG